MKNKLFFSIFCSILLFQPLLKASEIPTNAAFASIETGRVIPIADQSVLVAPCDPVNINCKDIVDYLTQIVQNSQDLNSTQIEELDQKIREAINGLQQVEEIRTNLKGEVEIPCRAVNCLIYTSWINSENKLFWINLHKQGTMQEYAPSKAVQIKSLKASEDIVKLNESINKLKAQFSAGISYENLSNAVSPFIQALESAQNSPEASKYTNHISEAKKISDMLSILSQTWNLYIESASVSGFTTTHYVSCKTAKNIRTIWNEAIGYEDLGKPKGGLLGCLLVDLGSFKDTTLPRYMLSIISIKLEEISNFTNQNKGTIPMISIPLEKQENNNFTN